MLLCPPDRLSVLLLLRPALKRPFPGELGDFEQASFDVFCRHLAHRDIADDLVDVLQEQALMSHYAIGNRPVAADLYVAVDVAP